MSDELRKAAENLLLSYEHGSLYALNPRDAQHNASLPLSRLKKLLEICAAYLAEHPSDDDEPVTMCDLAEELHGKEVTVAMNFGIQCVVCQPEIKTRGQLRKLLELLEGK